MFCVVLLKHDSGCWIALVGCLPCPTHCWNFPWLTHTSQQVGQNCKVSAAVGCGCLTQFLRQLSITLFARGSQRKVEGVNPWVAG